MDSSAHGFICTWIYLHMDLYAYGFICTGIHLHLDSSAQWFICTDLWIDLGSKPGTIHWRVHTKTFQHNNFYYYVQQVGKYWNRSIGIYFKRKILKFWNRKSKNTIGYSNIYFTSLPKRIFSGVYECQISTSPVRSLQFNLQISGTVPFNTW